MALISLTHSRFSSSATTNKSGNREVEKWTNGSLNTKGLTMALSRNV